MASRMLVVGCAAIKLHLDLGNRLLVDLLSTANFPMHATHTDVADDVAMGRQIGVAEHCVVVDDRIGLGGCSLTSVAQYSHSWLMAMLNVDPTCLRHHPGPFSCYLAVRSFLVRSSCSFRSYLVQGAVPT